MSHDLFNSLQDFSYDAGKKGRLYSLPALEKAGLGKISRLPVSLRVVLESALRNCDGKKITEEHLRTLAAWRPRRTRGRAPDQPSYPSPRLTGPAGGGCRTRYR